MKGSRCTKADPGVSEDGQEELVDPLPAKLRNSVVSVNLGTFHSNTGVKVLNKLTKFSAEYFSIFM